MTISWSERTASRTGTEILPRLLREAAVEDHVKDEGLRIVNFCHEGKGNHREQRCALMVPQEEATANSVPAAAVIQRWQALFGFTGRKGRVGGEVCRM